MANLGEELQERIKQSLDTEVAFYVNRGLINKEEQQHILDTFTGTIRAAVDTLSPALSQRNVLLFTEEPQEKSLYEKVEEAVENVMVKLGIKAYDDSPWDGNASQWKTPEAYCASCLIDMNDGNGPKTKDKCKLPYKKPGSSAINKGAMRAMAGGRGLPAVKGVPKDQIVKAANWMISHWQGAFDKPAPANIYRMAGKTPPSGSKESSLKVFKDKQGQWWMLGMYSNRWMDREHEILSEASHKEYADWVNKSGFKPQLIVYHLPKMPEGFWEKVWSKWGDNVEKLNEIVKKVYQKTSLAEVQRIVYLNGFSIAVSKVYPDKYEAAENLANYQEAGMSHGFLVFAEEDSDNFSSTKDTVNIVSKYRSFEMSVLLRKRAANYGTAPILVEEKSVAYSKEDREMISSLLGEEIANALDENTKVASEVMDEMLEYKELGSPEEEIKEEKEIPPAESEEKAAPAVENPEEECAGEDCMDEDGNPKKSVDKDSDVDVKEVVETVVKMLNVEQLQAVLATIVENQKNMSAEIAALKVAKETIVEEVKVLKQTEDEKIAEKFTPFNWGMVGFSPSTAKETEISKDLADKAKTNGPGAEKPLFTGNPIAEIFWNTIAK